MARWIISWAKLNCCFLNLKLRSNGLASGSKGYRIGPHLLLLPILFYSLWKSSSQRNKFMLHSSLPQTISQEYCLPRFSVLESASFPLAKTCIVIYWAKSDSWSRLKKNLLLCQQLTIKKISFGKTSHIKSLNIDFSSFLWNYLHRYSHWQNWKIIELNNS